MELRNKPTMIIPTWNIYSIGKLTRFLSLAVKSIRQFPIYMCTFLLYVMKECLTESQSKGLSLQTIVIIAALVRGDQERGTRNSKGVGGSKEARALLLEFARARLKLTGRESTRYTHAFIRLCASIYVCDILSSQYVQHTRIPFSLFPSLFCYLHIYIYRHVRAHVCGYVSYSLHYQPLYTV